jgi:Mn-containing catalase
MSNGEEYAGPWNEGKSPEFGEEWKYIQDPKQHVRETNGLLNEPIEGTERTDESVQENNRNLSAERKSEIDTATEPVNGVMSWSIYSDDVIAETRKQKRKRTSGK